MIVSGTNCATELLRAKYSVEKVIINGELKNKFDEIISLAKANDVKVEYVDGKTLNKISNSKNDQGVICFVKPYKYFELTNILKELEDENKEPFLVILDGIEDPHNVGALIRTADCMGVDAVIIPENRACEINETVFKTSAGAVAYVKVCKVVNISQTIEKLKAKNIWTYALEADGEDITKTNLTGAVAIVVGSEGRGVSRLVKKTCDATLSIKMCGKINSLNASNAGAIAMFEILRQRAGK